MTVVKACLRPILIILGILSVCLGVLGIFLPLLPTTPFLLLAAACFVRSSDRLYQWLLNNRWFGSYIRNYREGKGIPFRFKITAIFMLWLTILYSIIFVVSSLIIRIILASITIGVTIHLLHLKTLAKDS